MRGLSRLENLKTVDLRLSYLMGSRSIQDSVPMVAQARMELWRRQPS